MNEDTYRGSRFVFVGGSPRSGTTLVQNVLDSHPEIYGGAEFDYVPKIAELRNGLHASIDSGRIADYTDRQTVDRAIGELLTTLLLPVADRSGCRLLSEKSPINVLQFETILRIFPLARCVHVVRDPRAVYASLTRVAKRYQKEQGTVPAAMASGRGRLAEILEYQRAGFRAAERFPDRVHTVSYEALVQKPGPVVKALCAFLDVEFDPRMLTPEEVAHDGERLVDGIWYTTEEYRRPITAARIDAWRDTLDPAIEEVIVQAFGQHVPQLAALGYALEK